MIATDDHEFDAIWTAQRTVCGAPDRVFSVRKEVHLIVTPGKIIYITSTAADYGVHVAEKWKYSTATVNCKMM